MAISGNKNISLTEAGSGDTVNISEEDIIFVFDDTLGATVYYKAHFAGRVRTITVTETPSSIASSATALVAVSPFDKSTDFYINADRPHVVIDDPNSLGGSRSVLRYDNGASWKWFRLDQSKSTVQTNINNLS